jgi:hypothetical protein
MRIRDEKNSDPGSGMFIPDPQHSDYQYQLLRCNVDLRNIIQYYE